MKLCPGNSPTVFVYPESLGYSVYSRCDINYDFRANSLSLSLKSDGCPAIGISRQSDESDKEILKMALAHLSQNHSLLDI